MRKIFLLFYLLPTILFGQETKKIKTDREQYFVLSSDKSIKHGSYQLLNMNGKPIIEGYYKNGLKDSVWTTYSGFTEIKESKGNYSNDEKTGIWEYYDSKGNLEQKYDYTNKEIVFNAQSSDDKNTYRVIHDKDTVPVTTEKPPIYIGGTMTLRRQGISHIRYPNLAREYNISGTVYILFVLDKNGIAKDHRIVKGIGYGCDEEALKALKNLPNNWLPATADGMPVEMEITMPVNFILK